MKLKEKCSDIAVIIVVGLLIITPGALLLLFGYLISLFPNLGCVIFLGGAAYFIMKTGEVNGKHQMLNKICETKNET